MTETKQAILYGLVAGGAVLGSVYGFIGICIWLIQNGYGA